MLKHLLEFIIPDMLLPFPRSMTGASSMGCLRFVGSQTANSEPSAPALTNWIRYGLEPQAASAAAGVSENEPWSMRIGWKMLIGIELFPPIPGGDTCRAQHLHRKSGSSVLLSTMP